MIEDTVTMDAVTMDTNDEGRGTGNSPRRAPGFISRAFLAYGLLTGVAVVVIFVVIGFGADWFGLAG